MIEHLQLKNFKCFGEHTIPFGALTLLTGLNGAGKSSVIQALLALHQWWGHREGSAPWRGPLVNLGSFRDVLHEGATDDSVRIEASFGDRGTAYCEYPPRSAGEGVSPGFRFAPHPLKGELHYLSADRLGPRPALPLPEGDNASATPLGKRGQHVLRYLSQVGGVPVERAVRHHSEPRKTLAPQANAWLGVVCSGAKLDMNAIPDADRMVASYRYTRPAEVPSRAFRAGNVGFGVSYALPPIVALLAPKRDGVNSGDRLIIIENPEAHVHPAGQTSLAELAARAAAGGSQVILETHSDHVLDGVRLAVAEGILPHSQVVIHYFERMGLDVRITTPVLRPSGRLDVWPAGFFDQNERNLSRLIGFQHSSPERS